MFVIETKNSEKTRTIWTSPYKCPLMACAEKDRMQKIWPEWSVTVKATSDEEIKNARSGDYAVGGKTPAVPKWIFK